jgi:hypothetical protein
MTLKKNLIIVPAVVFLLACSGVSTVLAAGGIERVNLSSSFEQSNGPTQVAFISGDGRYVVFYSLANNLVPNDTNGKSDVFVRDRQANTTSRISVSSDGTQGNDHSADVFISSDGRYVVFASLANNLVPNDTNGWQDIFVRDTLTNITSRVNIATDGTQANDYSSDTFISADGRYVVFASSANNLVPNDTNNQADIFVRDRLSGVTSRVSLAFDGSQTNDASTYPSISANGRYCYFASTATNLVPNDTNGMQDIFVRDTVMNTTTRINVASDGAQANGPSDLENISADGRYVVFSSLANNLIPNDTNDREDIFLRDTLTNTTTRVSIATNGSQGNEDSVISFISNDGRYVTFSSFASNLVPNDTNAKADIFIRDRLLNTTTRVNLAYDGSQGNSNSDDPDISADGRYVVFSSAATNLVPNDTNGLIDIFVVPAPYLAPVVQTANPNSGAAGQTLEVNISISNFTSVSGAGFGEGITVNKLFMVNGNLLRATVVISSSAAPGSRTITVNSPYGSAALVNGFSVLAPPLPVQTKRLFMDDSSSPVINPAHLSIKNINIQTTTAYINQPVTVFANAVNEGDVQGGLAANLKINGKIEQTKSVTVNGQSAIPVQFTVYMDTPGTYLVDVNGRSVTLNVIGESILPPAISAPPVEQMTVRNSTPTSPRPVFVILLVVMIALSIPLAILVLRKR